MVAFDAPDIEKLASFYAELTGWDIVRKEPDWYVVRTKDGRDVAFQLAPDHVAPKWPGQELPQQFHLDIRVADIEEAEPKVLALGARRLPGEGGDFRVYADPVGHPFCLVWDA